MSLPTKSEEYAKLMEYLRKAQESAAMIMHLTNEDGTAPGKVLARGWFNISEALKKMLHTITELAKGHMN